MVFSPFTIPHSEEHEQDLRSGKTQVPYQDLVAVLQDIDEAEEELLSAVAGGYEYVRPLEEGHPEHPHPEQIEPATLRQLYLAMHEPLPDWTGVKGRRGRVKERYPIEAWQQQLQRWRQITTRICEWTLLHEQFLLQEHTNVPRSAAPSQVAQAG